MFKNSIPIGKVFGIAVRIHYSWFFIFALLTWALAYSYFPSIYPGWSVSSAIVAGLVTSLFFFGSVLAHELMHSIIAQRQDIPVRSITLFIFGGVSEMTEEPPRPLAEFRMAIAGPGTSIVLGGIFWGIWYISRGVNPFIPAVAYWLGIINIFLGVFNMIPGFPLDGGRVLRSILWWRMRNLRKATKISSDIGRGVGFLFIFGGILVVFTGNWFNGLWIAFIGWFLANAAAGSYRQLALQEILKGHQAREIMVTDCKLVDSNISIERFVSEFIFGSGRRCFPVAEEGRITGLVTLHNVKAIPREQWAMVRVKEAMTKLDKLKFVAPDADLSTVLQMMAGDDINQVPVIEDHNIVGMIGRDNLIAFMNLSGESET